MFDPDFYRNKLILAPMVRIGTLPMRLLALEYGADLVYTEELIDWKLLKTERQENHILDTIDYVDLSDGSVIFRTCKLERDKVILQIGTSNPQRALQTALKVQHDVAGLDINMGCPKSFSITGGMGAALMSNRTKAIDILKTLVDNTSMRITCKIRVFDDGEKTLEFVRELESTGISAIAIHGRTIHERPQHTNHNDIVSYVSDHVNIPVILNGCSKEIESFQDLKKLQKSLKSNSIMIARAAKWNCSIFRPDGLLDIETVIRAFIIKSIDYENLPSNTKYCIQNILRELQETPKGKLFLESQTLEQISSVWDLQEYFKQKHQERYAKRKRNDESQMHTKIKRTRLSTENVIELDCIFIRSNFKDDKDLPKTKLHTLATKCEQKSDANASTNTKPIYRTEQNDKLFRSVVEFGNRQFASRIWEKNKRYAEQAAALVCLCSIGEYDRQSLIENGTLLVNDFSLRGKIYFGRVHFDTPLLDYKAILAGIIDSSVILNVFAVDWHHFEENQLTTPENLSLLDFEQHWKFRLFKGFEGDRS